MQFHSVRIPWIPQFNNETCEIPTHSRIWVVDKVIAVFFRGDQTLYFRGGTIVQYGQRGRGRGSTVHM